MNEQAVRMAARIYEIRDTAKNLFGERYPGKSTEYQGYLRAAMAKHGVDSPLAAVHRIVKDMEAEKVDVGAGTIMLLTAAAADMVEPPGAP